MTQIGSADKGRTFVRVIHIASRKERIVVGIGDEPALAVADRLMKEIVEELGRGNAS